jgi:hypothetical protein
MPLLRALPPPEDQNNVVRETQDRCNFPANAMPETPGEEVVQKEEERIYICYSRLGLIKMDHCHSGNGRKREAQRR